MVHSLWYILRLVTMSHPFYLVNTRMRSKRDIKMARLCTPGGGGGGRQSSELSVWV